MRERDKSTLFSNCEVVDVNNITIHEEGWEIMGQECMAIFK